MLTFKGQNLCRFYIKIQFFPYRKHRVHPVESPIIYTETCFCLDNHIEHKNKLCGQHTEFSVLNLALYICSRLYNVVKDSRPHRLGLYSNE
jgi:hypothetical protein